MAAIFVQPIHDCRLVSFSAGLKTYGSSFIVSVILINVFDIILCSKFISNFLGYNMKVFISFS